MEKDISLMVMYLTFKFIRPIRVRPTQMELGKDVTSFISKKRAISNKLYNEAKLF